MQGDLVMTTLVTTSQQSTSAETEKKTNRRGTPATTTQTPVEAPTMTYLEALPKAAQSAATRPGKETDAIARVLLTALNDLPADHKDRSRIRARLIEMYCPLAEHLARRFRNR